MIEAIAKATKPWRDRVALMIARGVLRLVDDSGGVQRVQVSLLAGETRDGVDRVQQYGFTAVPLAGAEAVVVCVGGDRGHPIAIAIDDRTCRKAGLQPGEVAVYTDEGDYVLFKRGRVVEIKAGTKLVIDAPRVEVTGDLIDRTGSGQGHTLHDMRTIYDRHTHPDPQGGATSPPGEAM